MDIRNFFRNSVDVIITFLYVFAFPCAFFYRSSVLAAAILGLVFVFNLRVRREGMRLFYDPYPRRILFFMGYLLIHAYMWTKLMNANEFEQTRATFMEIGNLVGVVVLYAYLRVRHGTLGVLQILFYAFVAQSVIQIAGYASPTFLSYVRKISPIHGDPNVLYDYIIWRGFALAGSKYFGLSVVYSYIIVYYVFIFGKTMDWKKTILLLIYCAGGAFTARSFYLGVLMTVFVLCAHVFLTRPAVFFKMAWTGFIGVAMSIVLIPGTFKAKLESQLFPWLFEFWYTYKSTGRFETRSTKVLFKGHYDNLQGYHLITGDGYYLIPGTGGHPWMSTDAGYMRLIFFGGVLYLILRFIPFWLIAAPAARLRMPFSKMFFIMIIASLLVFQIKGDIFTGLTMLFVNLFLINLALSDLVKEGWSDAISGHVFRPPLPPMPFSFPPPIPMGLPPPSSVGPPHFPR